MARKLPRSTRQGRESALQIEELEPRLLLSADAVGVFTPDNYAAHQPVTDILLDDNFDRISQVPVAADIDIEPEPEPDYLALPLAFEANLGQTSATTDFFARGSGYSVFLSQGNAALLLGNGDAQQLVQINLAGANSEPAAQGLDELSSRSNYLIGNDPSSWRTDVANYAEVFYSDVYDGIDLRYYGNQRLLEYDFVVGPGANTDDIRLEIEGASQIEITAGGELRLVLDAAGEATRFKAPFSFQLNADGSRSEVSSAYHINSDGSVGFTLGEYDHNRELVIDPILDYGTYLGGTGLETANAIKVDSGGNAYITGVTSSDPYPNTTGPFGAPGAADDDVFITKLSPDGSSAVFTTYLGGSGADEGFDIDVDGAGNVYVVGKTASADFPFTSGAYDETLGGSSDGFVLKLNASGTALVYGSYIGSNLSNDVAYGVAVDGAGQAHVTGTLSGNVSAEPFETTNAFQVANAGGSDAYLAILNPAGSAMTYATYLGGTGSDEGSDIALDSAGNAYIVGKTNGSDIPVSGSAYQSASGGGLDSFFYKINPAGGGADDLLYGTYLGGTVADLARSVAVDDGSGLAYIAGVTLSGDFDTTPNAFDTGFAGGNDEGFFTVFDPRLSGAASLAYSTTFGGSGADEATGVAIDSNGVAWITGTTLSSDLPLTGDAFDASRAARDAFLTAINPVGGSAADLVYSSFLGGTGNEFAYDIALDNSGSIYLTGETLSGDFDKTPGAYDEALAGTSDGFVAKFLNPPAVHLWLNTENDVASGGVPGLDSWSGGTVLNFGPPNLDFNPTTSGTFSTVFNIDNIVDDGDARLSGLHYVGSNMLVGTNNIQLEAGDVLFSTVNDEWINGGAEQIWAHDILLFEPNSPGDYSSGTLSLLLDGSDVFTNFDIDAFTLVEQATTVGTTTSVNLAAGDFLISHVGFADNIYRYQPGTLGATSSGTMTVLVDGSDLGVDPGIRGLDLIEADVTIGDRTLTAGQLLVTLNSDDVNVGGIGATRDEIFIFDVTETETASPSVGTATAFFKGDDVGLNTATWQENVWGLSLANALPTGHNVTVTSTTDNNDAGVIAGNSSYDIAWLIANQGSDQKISLREAIMAANNTTNAGITSPDRINFEIEDALMGGVHTISVSAGGLPDLTDSVVLDGTTDADFAGTPIIELDGTSAGGGARGLRLDAGSDGSTVRGFVINRFDAAGMMLTASGSHTVVGNYIGTDPTGTIDRGNNDFGIQVLNSASNQIGGSTVADRNVISGNENNAISLYGSGSDFNIVQGNYIGVDAGGDDPLGNNGDGVVIGGGANDNQIGGDRTAGEGNVISGQVGTNADGIEIDNSGSDDNKIYGNYIGTNFDGSAPIGNARFGVVIYDRASGNEIGGTGVGQGNIISGNAASGVVIDGNGFATTTGNQIAGNTIGLDESGSIDLGNNDHGVYIFNGASGNQVGGDTAAHRNVVSGNNASGVRIENADLNEIENNYIGLNRAGTATLPTLDGIWLQNADGTLIGGVGKGNVIGGSTDSGIEIGDSADVVVQGNYIGTDVTATSDFGNDGTGVALYGASTIDALIGGTFAGTGNTVANSGNNGIYLDVNVSTGNTILGNSVFDNTQQGIELVKSGPTYGITLNDPGDGDSDGPNNLQNFPEITQADLSGTTLTVSGTLDTDGTTTQYRIEFFGNPSGTQDISHGEGRILLGSDLVTTNGSGDASFTAVALTGVTLSGGDFVTATATRVDSNGDVGSNDAAAYGDTSEFAANVAIAAATPQPVLFTIGSTASISEDLAETATITVTLAGAALSGGRTASVDITASGSAASGTDYDNFVSALVTAAGATTGVAFDGTATLTFDETFNSGTGQGSFAFTVDAIDDPAVEGTENIVATLSNPTASSGSASFGSFSDTFTETVNTNITAHTPDSGLSWVLYDTSTTTYAEAFVDATLDVIQGGPGMSENDTGQAYRAGPDPIGVDQTLSFTLSKIETDNGTKPVGLFGRSTDIDNFYYLRVLPNDNGQDSVSLWKMALGSPTLLDSIDVTIADGDTFTLEITDATKKAYHNGIEVLSVGDNELTAAGTWGFFIGNFNGVLGHYRTTWNIDSFLAEDGSASVAATTDITESDIAPWPAANTLWISGDQDIGAPGADGLPGGWSESEVLAFGGPDLVLGSSTDGDLQSVIDFDLFTANAVDVGALHYVSTDITIGAGADSVGLRIGDVLVSFNQDEDILAAFYETGVQTTVHMNDLLVFRPDTVGDYSTGTFYMLLDGVPDPLGAPISSLHGISLVEQDTLVGATPLQAGSFIFAAQSGLAPNTPNNIYHFAPTAVGKTAATGTSRILIDGSDINIEDGSNIRGLELVESATTVGGMNFSAGDILVTLSVDDAVVGNAPTLSTATSDIFVLKVTQAEPEAGSTTAATAEMVFQGSDVNFSSVDSERVYALAIAPENTRARAQDDRVGLSFDGIDDYIRIENDPSLVMSTNFTIEAWINISPTASGSQLVVNKEGEYELGVDADTGELKWAIAEGVSWAWRNTGAFISKGEWTHVALSYDAGTVRTYANGALVHTYSQTSPVGDVYTGFNSVSISGRENSAGERFDGLIDEVRIWDVTRTEGEIKAYRNDVLAAPGAEANLVGYWRFDEGQGTQVNDLSSAGNHGALGGLTGPSAEPAWAGYIVDEDTLLTVVPANGVLANDIDLEGDSLTVTNVDDAGMLGALSVAADGSFSYDPRGAFDALGVGQYATDTFTYTANDGIGNSTTATVTITVTGVEDTAVITASAGTTAYNEQAGAAVIDGAITLEDADSPVPSVLSTATIQITGNYTVDDLLGFADTPKIEGSLSGDTLTLSVVTAQTPSMAEFEAALQSVTFYNGSDTPSELDRTVSFTFNDGVVASNTTTKVVEVTEVNDPLTGSVTIDGTVTQGQGLTANTTALGDLDGLNTFTYQWYRGATPIGANAATYTLVQADVGASITVEVSYTDGAGNAESDTSAAVGPVANINDAPVLAGANNLTAINENPVTNNGTLVSDLISGQVTDPDTTPAYGIAVTAVDDTNGTWQYTTNSGTTWLDFDPVTTATARLLTDNASTFVRFVPDTNWNGTVTNGLTFHAWDQTSGSAGGTGDVSVGTAFSTSSASSSIAVGAVNNIPVVTASGGATTYNEQATATAIDTGITLVDADGTNGTEPSSAYTATIQVTGNYTASDVLGFTDTLDIQGNLVGDTLTLSVIGGQTASITDFQAALRSVTFYNGSDTPSELDRTVSFTFNDGVVASNTTTKVVEVTEVNDPLTGSVTIDGTVTQGQGLTANTTALGDLDGLNTFTYQWYRGATPIGANAATYTLVQADVGASITVEVSYTDGAGNAESDTSAAVGPVANINDAPVLAGANNLTAINENPVTNNGTLVSDLISGQVTDPDTTPAYGIAVTAVDDTNGTWQYTTNSGTSWLDFDPVTTATARLLTDNASTFVRFVPDTNWNGTVTNGLTFHAWDQTSGSAGGTGDVSAGTAFSTSSASSSIAVGAVNNIPVVTASGGATAYNEQAGAAVIDAAITLVDADGANGTDPSNLYTATVQVTGNYEAADLLGFTDTADIEANLVGDTLTLSVIGGQTASVADFQAALRSVTFYNGSDTPSELDRTVSFIFNDSVVNSNAANKVVEVTALNDAPTGTVAIGGTTSQGSTLTASDTLADADGLGTITYTWKADGTTVGTSATYLLTEAEVGTVITVEASYLDGGGTNETVASGPTAAVTNVNDAPTGTVSISGTASQGNTLTASNTLADADGLGTITYTWKADGGTVGTGTTYVLTGAEVGKTITVQASYTDGHGTPEAVTSGPAGPVTNVNDPPTGTVTISGTAAEDQTLTAANTLADADGLGPITYQWFRGATPISGGTTYTLVQADVGASISVTASYTDGGGTNESVSSAGFGPIANTNDAPTGAPGIAGTAKAGNTLTAVTTGIADEDGLGTFSHTWQRSTDGGTSWTAVGSGSSYLLGTPDVGADIRVQVAYTDAQGSPESLASTPVVPVPADVVAPPPPPPPPEPVPEPTPEPVPEPVPEPTPEPVPEPVPEPTPEPVPEPVPEPTPEPVPEPTPEPEPVDPAPVVAVEPTPTDTPRGDNDPIIVSIASTSPADGGSGDSGETDPVVSESTDPATDAETRLGGSTRVGRAVEAEIAAQGIPPEILELIEAGQGAEPPAAEAIARQEEFEPTQVPINQLELDRLSRDARTRVELAHVDAVMNNPAMWREIDAMKKHMDETDNPGDEFVVEMVSTTSVGLMAGLVAYALRGGALLASLMSTMPLWTAYDPLPILVKKKDNKKGEQDENAGSIDASKPGEIDALFE